MAPAAVAQIAHKKRLPLSSRRTASVTHVGVDRVGIVRTWLQLPCAFVPAYAIFPAFVTHATNMQLSPARRHTSSAGASPSDASIAPAPAIPLVPPLPPPSGGVPP